MNVRSFGGTLCFGIAAGVIYPGFSLLAAPVLGAFGALQTWIAFSAIAYATLLGTVRASASSVRSRRPHSWRPPCC